MFFTNLLNFNYYLCETVAKLKLLYKIKKFIFLKCPIFEHYKNNVFYFRVI